MSNSDEIRIKKKHITIGLIAAIAASLIIPYQIFAQNQSVPPRGGEFDDGIGALDALGSVFVWASSNVVEEKSWYVIRVKTATICAIKTVEMEFPSGYDLSGAKTIEKVNIGGGVLSRSASPPKLIYTVSTATSVPAGTTITIMLSEIVNPNAPNYKVTVTTKNQVGAICDGPTSSATYPLKQITSSVIADNSIGKMDISQNFMKFGQLTDDSNGNAKGWNPDKSTKTFSITDADISIQSMIFVSISNNNIFPVNAPTLSSPTQAALVGVTATPLNPVINEVSTYVIAFQLGTAGTDVKSETITFPVGFDVTNANMIEVNDGACNDQFQTGVLTVAGQTLIWDHTLAGSPGTGITITMTIGNIVNANTLNNQITMSTRTANQQIIDGPTLSSVFQLQGPGIGGGCSNVVVVPNEQRFVITCDSPHEGATLNYVLFNP
jgi:hypothetical protein